MSQSHGAPPNFGNVVWQSLNAQFQNKWIGRWGPISWPARSPVLSPSQRRVLRSDVTTTVRRQNIESYSYSYSNIYPRHVGAHVATAELQVGFMPRYKNGDHIEIGRK